MLARLCRPQFQGPVFFVQCRIAYEWSIVLIREASELYVIGAKPSVSVQMESNNSLAYGKSEALSEQD